MHNFNRPYRDESLEADSPRWKRRAIVRHPYEMHIPSRSLHSYFVENLNTVFDLNVSPGFKIVLGKSG